MKMSVYKINNEKQKFPIGNCWNRYKVTSFLKTTASKFTKP